MHVHLRAAQSPHFTASTRFHRAAEEETTLDRVLLTTQATMLGSVPMVGTIYHTYGALHAYHDGAAARFVPPLALAGFLSSVGATVAIHLGKYPLTAALMAGAGVTAGLITWIGTEPGHNGGTL